VQVSALSPGNMPLLVGLAVVSLWLALGGPLLSSFARMGLENNPLAMYRASISGSVVPTIGKEL